jgi:hypothetical protein
MKMPTSKSFDDNPEQVPGPYWLDQCRSDGQIRVCGRRGKIIKRFSPEQEKEADDLVRRLMEIYQ